MCIHLSTHTQRQYNVNIYNQRNTKCKKVTKQFKIIVGEAFTKTSPFKGGKGLLDFLGPTIFYKNALQRNSSVMCACLKCLSHSSYHGYTFAILNSAYL